jgi:hypothetical protein
MAKAKILSPEIGRRRAFQLSPPSMLLKIPPNVEA